jgi:glycosyltransferase involved in cell wall biosynthesis
LSDRRISGNLKRWKTRRLKNATGRLAYRSRPEFSCVMLSCDISLSVALVTCNRPDSLERALASLRSQSVQPFEVIVSDDSVAEHAEPNREVAMKHHCIYRVGPRRGLYANRNFAARQCRGSHIRTMDDDHVLPRDHFSQCLEAMKSDPEAIWTTGEIGYLNAEAVNVAEVANQLGPSGVGERIENRGDNWGISDGSTIYPRDVFDRGYHMVEDFGFGSSYLEFGAFLYKNGWKCRCITGALVEHFATVLSKPDPASIVFASICFNAYFRPNLIRLGRYLAPRWRELRALPKLIRKAQRRWSAR